MAKNIVICLDGTSNEPEKGQTNVARTFDMLEKDRTRQLTYYDPGVGTMGARSATTRIGKTITRVTGLALGHGVQENITEAYQYLMDTYEPEDKIYIFGFSRGAYTARALAGLLRTVGLLEPGATNLIPYALKLYTGSPKENSSKEKSDAFWDSVQSWNDTFGNPGFQRFAKPVHFLGVWDTVKSIGWLNFKGRFQQAKWPFTRNVSAVAHGRHAVSIDEKRRYYDEYLFTPKEVAKTDRDLRELWFAGVHSDVGGTFDEHELADITLKWMVDEAVAAGMLVRPETYQKHVSVPQGQPLPASHASGPSHPAGVMWAIIGFGWRRRKVPAGAHVHRSVETRVADAGLGYKPKLDGTTFVDR